MRSAKFLFPGSLVLFLIWSAWTVSADSSQIRYLSPRVTADYIFSVIEADRTIYSEYIVQRLNETINLPATETWKEDDTLLLPAQFLLAASALIHKDDLGLKFRLMGQWPINPDNGPRSKEEKKGLIQVAKTPDTPFTWFTHTGAKTMFNAVYPDKAVTESCVECHNIHPSSPKKDFKKGDVMGGIHISFPVNKLKKKSKGSVFGVSPRRTADFVHAILEADRTVYARHIVNRLQKKKVVFASENWWEDNTLLLPAQFMLNASELIRQRRRGLDFRLISLWPINSHNGPANEFENLGLQEVIKRPGKPHTDQIKVGNKEYFQAVYPDIAVTPSCVVCHNEHPKSPKRDYKLFDVLGGIVVSLPINRN